MPARASRQPIYIAITITEANIQGRLSGKYNFHGLKNGSAAFIRAGGKVEGFEKYHPYYLMYHNKWFITKSDDFEKNEQKGWLLLKSQGLSEC